MRRSTPVKAIAAAAAAVAVYYAVQMVLLKRAERELERAKANLAAAQADLHLAKAERDQALIDQDAAMQAQAQRHEAEMAELEEIGARLKAATTPEEREPIQQELTALMERVFAPEGKSA